MYSDRHGDQGIAIPRDHNTSTRVDYRRCHRRDHLVDMAGEDATGVAALTSLP